MPTVLRLEAREFAGLSRWRWVLTDAGGAFLADHEVRLDEHDWQYEAALDLHKYISWHASPDKHYAADEARIVYETGAWLGQRVLGPAIAAALVTRRPATVGVVIPPGAEALAFLPLEIAHAEGKPLARHDVTLVVQAGAADCGAGRRDGGRDRLRVLGLFSLPEGGTPLNLRRERHALVKLIDGIAAHGRAAEIRVLQYGVTRERLRDVLEEAGGWDIIHISGHGRPGELLLETAAGRPDRIGASDLADLLDGAREHVRLVTVSACWSAALSPAEQPRSAERPGPPPSAAPPAARTLATELSGRLGCAVLAMRYPVDDEFATSLSGKLYELLAAKGQPLPQAVAMTLRQLNRDGGSGGHRYPALSLAAPAIFGGHATELRLLAPPRSGPASYATENLKMAGFPPQPDRFVGRTGVMARASEALADESGVPGILLHGMPGGGKTACAVEMAYTHEHAVDRVVWHKAPDEGMEISGALTDFALTLERCLDGFQMIHVLADDQKLTGFLPRLTELMKRNRLLIVLDNAESLLTASGQWRDDRWGQVIAALTGHRGLGRLVMTSRRVPAETPPLRVEAVDALTVSEALLLARELPNLRTLIWGELPGVDRDTARKLAAGVLNTAQGHPKLLELADGQAGHPEQLAALIEAGDQAWRDQGGLPENFFSGGSAPADSSDYLHVLAAWTNTVTGTLSPAERDLFWFLCCLEEPDRVRPAVKTIWTRLWPALGHGGDAPAPDRTLPAIVSCGLAALRKEAGGKDESYAIHPGVAAAGRDRAGDAFQDSVDRKAAAYWYLEYRRATGEMGDGTVDTRLLVRAGLAATPYLIRWEQWADAAALLHNAFIRDSTRANGAIVLPALRYITRHDPRQAIALATVLQVLGLAAAEPLLRTSLDNATAKGDYRSASLAAGRLFNVLWDSGRLAEALALTEQKAGYTRQAGFGPWAEMSDEVQRLQVLNALGRASQVLGDVRRLREHIDTLPVVPGPSGHDVPPWHVREGLLHAGCDAAIYLGQWQDALDLNAARLSSLRDRRAPIAETARVRFDDYGPLLRLGRTSDALALLLDCRRAFQGSHDVRMLGKTFTALATVEGERGHGDAASRLQRDAFRYGYLAGDVDGIATSYHNFGNQRRADQPVPAFAGHLTAALVRTLTGSDGTGIGSADHAVRAAAEDLLAFGAAAEAPADIADLCRKLGDIPGTDPAGLIAELSPDPETAERTLRDLIARAQALADGA